MKVVNRFIGVSAGYLGDFSYRTHGEFYPEYCDLDIDPNTYPGTTRERFIEILSTRSPHDQAKILRGVLDRFGDDADHPSRSQLRPELEEWITRLEGAPAVFPQPDPEQRERGPPEHRTPRRCRRAPRNQRRADGVRLPRCEARRYAVNNSFDHAATVGSNLSGR